MSDDESVRPAAESDPTPGSTPVPTAPTAPTEVTEPTAATEVPAPTEVTDVAETTEQTAPTEQAEQAEQASPAAPVVAADDPPAATAGPGLAPAPGAAVAFLKAHAVTLVLAVLLVAAIVWGALGMTSAADWESRAASLSADLRSVEENLADAQATIDDLETAKSRAESTATACVGAIADADAMLEVSAKIDEKTVVYLDGLNDFMAAVNAGDLASAETIAGEIDKLSIQIEALNKQIQGHIDDYGDAAEGCHVDDAQDV